MWVSPDPRPARSDMKTFLIYPQGIVARLRSIMVAGVLMFATDASALTANHVPGLDDAAFYTFALTVIAVSAAIIWAYGEFRWMAYVVLFLFMLIGVASIDGNLAYVLGGGDFVLWVVPFLLQSSIAAFGFFIVAARLEAPHPLASLRRVFLLLAAVASLFPLSSPFWLEKISLVTMWQPVNVLFFLMLLSQSLPPLTWPISDPLQKALTRFFPLIVAALAITVQGVHYAGEGLSQNTLNTLYRLTALLYATSSLAVVVWQVVANTREKLRAERQMLEAERNEAQLQLALTQTRSDFQDAMSAVSHHRSRLATVSHDLKQPVVALRHAVDQMQRAGYGDDAKKLSRAIDYVASLSHAYVQDEESGGSETSGARDEQKSENVEFVDSATFAQMLQQMFCAQAQEQGVRLRVICPSSRVWVEPLPTMRIMTNLVSNALAHAQAKRIVIGFRPHGTAVIFQVHDDGVGIDDEALVSVLESGVKGAQSDGHGLGLGIVNELCRGAGMEFRLSSQKGRGTSAFVSMPRSLPSAPVNH